MKSTNTLAIAGMVLMTAFLVACGKTKNDSNASTPTSTCTRSWDGSMRDQQGRACGASATYNQCANAYYNGQYYIDRTTGQQVNCNYQNGVPQQGYGQGCQGWSQVYPGEYYVPVDLGGGQLICMNTRYLYQSQPNYFDWNNYYAYYQQPMQYYNPYYGGGCGGSSIYVNYDFGNGNIGGNLCF